jgi:hypothetical protein
MCSDSSLHDSNCIDESEENNGRTDESTDLFFEQIQICRGVSFMNLSRVVLILGG